MAAGGASGRQVRKAWCQVRPEDPGEARLAGLATHGDSAPSPTRTAVLTPPHTTSFTKTLPFLIPRNSSPSSGNHAYLSYVIGSKDSRGVRKPHRAPQCHWERVTLALGGRHRLQDVMGRCPSWKHCTCDTLPRRNEKCNTVENTCLAAARLSPLCRNGEGRAAGRRGRPVAPRRGG